MHNAEKHYSFRDWRTCERCNPGDRLYAQVIAYERGCNSQSLTRRIATWRSQLAERIQNDAYNNRHTPESSGLAFSRIIGAWDSERNHGIGTAEWWEENAYIANRVNVSLYGYQPLYADEF